MRLIFSTLHAVVSVLVSYNLTSFLPNPFKELIILITLQIYTFIYS